MLREHVPRRAKNDNFFAATRKLSSRAGFAYEKSESSSGDAFLPEVNNALPRDMTRVRV